MRKIYAGPAQPSAFLQDSSCITYLCYLNAMDAPRLLYKLRLVNDRNAIA